MKITIITPTFNARGTIEDTIESVRRQKLSAGLEIEHLIIDGGSSDGTAAFATISERDHGLYDAINKGIRMSTGDVIGICNSDDVFASDDVISKIAEGIDGVDAIYADVRFVGEGHGVDNLRKASVTRYCTGRFFKRWMFRFATFPAHPSTFVRRECFEKYGLYSLDYPICADFEMMLRLFFCKRITARYLPFCTHIMRMGGLSTKNFAANVAINRQDLRALKANHVWSCLPLIYTKYIFKIWGYVFRKRS